MDIGLEQKKIMKEEDTKALFDHIEKGLRGDEKGLAQVFHRFYEVDRFTEFGFDTFEDFVRYCGIDAKMAMELISIWSTVESFVTIGEKWVSRLDWESLCLIHNHRFSLVQLNRIREISDQNFQGAIKAFLQVRN